LARLPHLDKWFVDIPYVPYVPGYPWTA